MPRIRTVKPEVVKHETLFDAEQDTGLPIRFAWVMLPCLCDREGRFKWKPRRMKPDLLPYDEGTDVSPVLDAFLARGLVVKYRVRGEWYGWIPTFTKHQVINNRESSSELPTPSDADEVIYEGNHELDVCATRSARVNDAQGTPGKGKGREGNKEGKEGGEKSEIDFSCLPIQDRSLVDDYVSHRKKHKLQVTQNVINRLAKQLHLCADDGIDPDDALGELLDAGWRTLKVDWVRKRLAGSGDKPQGESEIKWANRRAVEMGEKEWPGPAGGETQQQFIDRIKRLDREAA